ncbi:MAG: HAD-IB family phosphatase, partial [Myxococcota bacterium]
MLDFDGTLSPGYISVAFMERLHEVGLYCSEIYQQQRALLADYENGGLSHEDWVERWGELWAAGLKGKQTAAVENEAAAFFEEFKDAIFTESKELVERLTLERLRSVMLSAGAQEVVQRSGEHLGVDSVLATRAESREGVYTGVLLTDVHTPAGKGRVMRDLVDRQGPPVFAFGDSSGDMNTLALAIYPVALNPSTELETVAKERGWTVLRSDG